MPITQPHSRIGDEVSLINDQLDQLEASRPLPAQRFRTWPITECENLNPKLRALGLKLSASEIDGTSTGRGN